MKQGRRVGFIICIIFFCCGIQQLKAQLMPEPAGADSVRSAFLPVASYSSDVGLIGGAIYNRFDYRGNVTPFKSYVRSMVLASTKGYIKINLQYEQTSTFGSDLRSIGSVFFNRLALDNFFGVGNGTQYSEQLWDEDFYYFESYNTGLDLKVRKPVYRNYDSGLDFIAGLGLEYQIPYVRQPNSTFNQIRPNGIKGGFVNYVTAGFMWENRNREFNPQSGNMARLEVRHAPKYLGDYALTALRLDLRQYFYVWDFLTIANRLQARHVDGDVPYWELATLGNDETLRGYPLNRFQGTSSIAYNLEFRSWMFTFPEYQLKIGVHLFTDAGRVFTAADGASDLFKGYKQTVGFGGALSLFSPDFIMRGEMGFSEDDTRIYVGVGYSF